MANHTLDLKITGMNCGGCVGRVEKALKAVDHVTGATVSLADNTAVVTTACEIPAAHLTKAVEDAGYHAALIEDDMPTDHHHTDESLTLPLARIFLPGILGLPLMPLGWLGVLPMHIETPFNPTWTALLLLAIPVMAISGWHMYKDAAVQARHLHANMHTLIALGTLAAWVYSAFVVFAPQMMPPQSRHIYLEAGLIILCLVNLGHFIEHKARRRTTDAIRQLLDLTPPTATVVREGGDETIPASQITLGMILRIRPGERIPVDGTITEGTSDLDESMLTGEPLPATRTVGEPLYAGTLNTNGTLLMEATAVGSKTVLTQMAKLVKQAQASKPPVGRLADTIAGYFAMGVIVIAIVTFAIWWLVGPEPQLAYAFSTALAVLVIACPCALGLATPISIMAGIGKAARHGMLIRNADALERLQSVTTIVFDKTGTLTHGKPAVTRIEAVKGTKTDALIRLLASAEQGSEHPVAHAILQHAAKHGIKPEKATDFKNTPGKGIQATVGGKTLLVGSLNFLKDHQVDVAPLQKFTTSENAPFAGVVAIAVEGKAAGLALLEDTLRDGVADVISALKRRGITPVMLTGDREATAKHIAKMVGIDQIKSDATPEDKINLIKDLQDKGNVVCMIGDGINDAPALAQADVGIAIGGGTGVAIESAPITLTGGSLGAVLKGIDISRATMRNIRQNLVGAFGYNMLGVPLAAGVLFPFTGWLLSPVFAGAAMAFSSATVVFNAGRLLRYEPANEKDA